MKKSRFKRAMSILLCVILTVTSFCIFDPSLLKQDALAYGGVDSNKLDDTMPSVLAAAPESIYMAPGTNSFSKYLNHESTSGAVTQAVSDYGDVYFNCSTATNVKLKVNDVYYYDKTAEGIYSTTVTHARANSLTLNSVNVGSPCSIGVTKDGSYTNSDRISNTQYQEVAIGSNGELKYRINSGNFDISQFDTTPPEVVFIEWVVGYFVNNVWHYEFLYTAIYLPNLSQAGMISDVTSNVGTLSNRNITYSFVTGVQAVAGGTKKSNFVKAPAAPYSPEKLVAPVISFSGSSQNGNNATIPGGANVYTNSTYFANASNGGIFSYGTSVNETNGNLAWSCSELETSVGSKTFPTAVANIPTISGGTTKLQGSSVTAVSTSAKPGVGFITVDTSRFKNYNQIPNLSLGWAQLYHDVDSHANSLAKIQACDLAPVDVNGWVAGTTNYASKYGITVNFDNSLIDCSSTQSTARGVYKISGAVTNDSPLLKFYFGTKASNGASQSYTASMVSLKVISVDKSTLRKQCRDADCSGIDRAYYLKAGGSAEDFYVYYSQKKAACEKLCNPLNDAVSAPELEATRSSQQARIEGTDNSVYFYVPEAVYTKPEGNVSSATTHYSATFVDGAVDLSTKALTLSSSERKYGNLYFSYVNATNINISYQVVSSNPASANNKVIYAPSSTSTSGTTLYSTGYSSTASVTTTSNNIQRFIIGTETYLNATEYNAYLKWTASYFDKADGKTKSVTAYTYIYRTNAVPIATAVRTSNNDGSRSYAQSVSWVSGLHNVTSNGAVDGVTESYYTNCTAGTFSLLPYSYTYQTGTGATIPGGSSSLKVSENTPNISDKADATKVLYLYSGTSSLLTTSVSNTSVNSFYNSTKPTTFHRNVNRNATYVSKNGDHDWVSACCVSPLGTITVDTSRYSNLNQVPGFSVGLFVTDDEGSDDGIWYVSTASRSLSGETKTGNAANYGNEGVSPFYDTDRGTMIAGYDRSGNGGRVGGAELEGVKYNGKGDFPLNTADTTFSVKNGYVNNNDGEKLLNVMVCRFNVVKYNKVNLRTAVQRAIHLNNQLQQELYDATKWNTYVSAYDAAAKALTKLDGTMSTSADSLATALNNAINALLLNGRKSGTANIKHMFLTAGGTLNTAKTTITETKSFNFGDDLHLCANEYEGYSCVGYYAGTWSNGLAFVTEGVGAPLVYRGASTVDIRDAAASVTYTFLYKPEYKMLNLDFNGGSIVGQSATNLLSSNSSFNSSWSTGATTEGGAFTYSYSAGKLTMTTTATNSSNYYRLYVPNAVSLTPGGTYTFSAKSSLGWTPSDYIENTWEGVEGNEKCRIFLKESGGSSWIYLDLEPFNECSFVVPSSSTGKYQIVVDVLSVSSGTKCEFTDFCITNQQKTFSPATPSSPAGVLYGNACSVPAGSSLVKQGYTFAGWTLKGTGTFNGTTWTAGATDDILVATWKRKAPDVTFDNYLSFDKWTTGFSVSNATSSSVDNSENTITLTSKSGTSTVDCYTNPYFASNGMQLQNGHVYELSYNFEANKSSLILYPFIFTYASATSTDYGTITTKNTDTPQSVRSGNPNGNSNAYKKTFSTSSTTYRLTQSGGVYKGTDKVYFYVNSARPYVNFRLGTYTPEATITFSDLAIRDVTNPAGTDDDVSVPFVTKNSQNINVTAIPASYGLALSENELLFSGLPTVTRTGYTFKGWNTKPDGSGTACNVNTVMGDSELKLYSQWQIATYTVSFNTTSSGVAAPQSFTKQYNQAIGNLPTVTKAGYTFEGWYYEAALTNKAQVTDLVTGNKVLYPKFTADRFTVKYNVNGGSGSVSDTVVMYNEAVSLSSTVPTRTGWNFLGWATSSTATSVTYTASQALNATAVNNIYSSVGKNGVYNLYAVWSLNCYNITVDPNGGVIPAGIKYVDSTGATKTAVNSTGASQTVGARFGSTVEIAAITKTGYTHTGWEQSVVTQGSSLQSKVSSSISARYVVGGGDAKLTATWSVNSYQVTVNPLGGTVTGMTYTGSDGTQQTANLSASTTISAVYKTIVTVPMAKRTGYTFNGWKVNSMPSDWTFVNNTNTNSTIMVGIGSCSVEAKWVINSYSVSINPAGGTVSNVSYKNASGADTSTGSFSQSKTVTAQYNSTVSIANPVRTGYNFSGWSFVAGLGTVGEKGASATPFTVGAGDGWITANWNIGSYKITVNPAGGTVSNISYTNSAGITANTSLISETTEITARYNTMATIAVPQKTGYVFSNWNVSVGFQNAQFTDNGADSASTYVVGGDISITAVYSVATYSVTVDPSGGTVFGLTYVNASGAETSSSPFSQSKTISAKFGSTLTLEAPVKTGYVFNGWNVSAPADATYEENSVHQLTYVVGSGAARFTAQFNPGTFTVRFDSQITGGATLAQDITATYGIALELSRVSTPVRTGYVFNGWSTISTNDLGETVGKLEGNSIEASTINAWYSEKGDGGTKVLYALWDLSTATVNVYYYKKGALTYTNNVSTGYGVSTDATTYGATASCTASYGTKVEDLFTVKPETGYTMTMWKYSTSAPNATITASWGTQGTPDCKMPSSNLYVVCFMAISTSTVTFDFGGGSGGTASVIATGGSAMPSVTVPTYPGYVFNGYYSLPGGEGTKYYSSTGTSVRNCDFSSNITLYASWICPILSNVEYSDGMWKYTFLTSDFTATVQSAKPVTTADELTALAPSNALISSSTAMANTDCIKSAKAILSGINLNSFTSAELGAFKDFVQSASNLATQKQPAVNEKAATVAVKALSVGSNDTTAPKISIYETAQGVNSVKESLLTAQQSVTGTAYTCPEGAGGIAYVDTSVPGSDYVIYANSNKPVIALVTNDSCYPTSFGSVTANDSAIGKYMVSAIYAGDCGYGDYLALGIGNQLDYNAKGVVYLTPEFTTKGSVTYTISAQDSFGNKGVNTSSLAAQGSETAYNFETEAEESITITVVYKSAETYLSGTATATTLTVERENVMFDFNEYYSAADTMYKVYDEDFGYAGLGSFVYSISEEQILALTGGTSVNPLDENTVNAVVESLAQRADSLTQDAKDQTNGFQQFNGSSVDVNAQGIYVLVHSVDKWGRTANALYYAPASVVEYFRANSNSTCVISGKYIYGLKPNLTAGQLKNTFLDYEGVTVTYTKADEGYRYYGTGSTVTVEYADGTTEEYIIIIYGDVDGDGTIGVDDASLVSSVVSGSTQFTAVQTKAGNVDGVRGVRADDHGIISAAAALNTGINQVDPTMPA